MQDELVDGEIIIRRLVREDDVVVNISKSDGLPYIEAMGMTAFAMRHLGDIYEVEEEER